MNVEMETIGAEPGRARPERADASLRTLAILFVDCTESWSAVPERRSALIAALMDAAASRGSVHLDRVNDGVVATFPSVEPAIGLVDEVAATQPPGWRAGLHVGDVSTTPDGKVFGVAVHLAARLYQNARPDHGLASRAASLLSREPSRFVAGGHIAAKGFPEPIEVYEIAR